MPPQSPARRTACRQIVPEHAEAELRRRHIDAAIGRRERTSGIDRIREQASAPRRPRTPLRMQAPCSNVSRFRDSRNETRKNRQYPDDRNRFGSRKLTARPISRPISAVRTSRSPRRANKQLRGQKPRERADHHCRRHRIARLGRIDHQVDHDVPEGGDKHQRKDGGGVSNGEEAQSPPRRPRPEHTAGSPEIRMETAPAQTRFPADTGSPVLFVAGISV